MSKTESAAGPASPGEKEENQGGLFEEMTASDKPQTGRELVPVEPENTEPEELSLAGRSYSAESPMFGRDEVMVPRLRLAQGLTGEVQSGEAHPGEWVLTGYGAEQEVRITPLMFSRARELRSTEDNTLVLCSSPDAVVGTGTPGGQCELCPLSKWTESVSTKRGANPKNDPPKCTFIYSYVCWSHTHSSLVVVELKRTAVNVAKLINTMIATKGLGNFAMSLKSQPMKGPRGTYFIPQASPGKMTDEELDTARLAMPTL